MPYFLINFFLSTIWRALNWPHLSHITLQDCFLNAFPRFIDNYNVAQETGSEFILKTVIQCISIQNPPSFKTDVNETCPANCTVFRPDANAVMQILCVKRGKNWTTFSVFFCFKLSVLRPFES